MNSAQAESVVAAGGVVPPSVEIETEIPLDPVAARSWTHPGLPEPVVLIDLKALAPARDLEMDFLGFDDPSDLGEVGKQPRRALGFPGSAIISDPDNAGFALEVVKEFRKAARRAQSKPGHAKTAIDAIGKKLGKSVPHFLPSFYEEACRMFLEAGNKTYAGQMFEKAREAERVHALEVDETLRENTFVEFALAGALAIKSLTNYAKELASSAEPGDAYQTFRRVCVKRTLGGLPPWSKMAAELKRLAKAAKLDVAAEEQAVLAEIIDAPSLAKAAKGFWKPYTRSLVALCDEQPAIRKQLLELFPAVPPREWLEILDKCGALAGVTNADADPEVKPGGRLGAWFERLSKFGSGWYNLMPDRTFELLDAAAPVLRQEATPLNLFGRYEDGDLDYIERAFQLEIPLVDPPDNARFFRLDTWAEQEGEHRLSDPLGIAADQRYAVLLDDAIDSYLGREPLTTVALERDGFRGAIESWLTGKLDAVESGGALPDLYQTLNTLRSKATGKVWTAFPEQLARLEGCTAAPALVETLRIGIFDEHGWDAFDEAVDSFAEDAELTITGVFPRIVVSDGVKAIVVGPGQRIAEHDLKMPAGARLLGFRFSQDQLMVLFRPADTYESHAYWSGNPDETFQLESSYYSYGSGGSVAAVLDDGSLVTNGKAFCAGDRWALEGDVISDGESFWVKSGDWSDRHFRELDPRTGKHGRKSMPAFFEGFQQEGSRLNVYSSWLYPLPEGASGAAIGAADGVCGLRVRYRDAESPVAESVPHLECERTDGVTWVEREAPARRHNIPELLLTVPGDDAPRPVFSSWRSLSIASPGTWVVGSNTHRHYRRGTPRALPPLAWWSALEPRDPEGSKALRQVTAEQAAALIEAGAAARTAAERDEKTDQPIFAFEGTALASAISEIFDGAITNPRLARGVGGLAWMAAGDAERLVALVESASQAAAEAGAQLAVDPPALKAAVADFGSFSDESKGIAEIAVVSEMFDELADGESRVQPAGAGADWESLIGARGALAYRCVVDVTSDEARAALLELLDAFAASSFVDRVDELRMIKVDKSPEAVKASDQIFAFRQGASRYFGWHHYDKSATLLEWAEGGEFQLPAGGESIASETRPYSSWGTADDVAALRARLESDGPIDVKPLVEAVAAETHHTETEALMLLGGLYASDYHAVSRRYSKLKARQVELARAGVRCKTSERVAILSDAFTADPGAPWDDPAGLAANLAAAWNRHRGQVVEIDEAVAAELAAAKVSDNPTHALRLLGAPDSGAMATDGAWELNEDNNGMRQVDSDDEVFTTSTLDAVAGLFPWLSLYAPVGDPVRSQIPAALAAVKRRLDNENMWLEIADPSFYDDDAGKQAFIDAFGGEPMTGRDGKEIPGAARKPGFIMLPARYGIEIYAQPRMFREEPNEVTRLRAFNYWTPAWVKNVELVFGGSFDRIAARIAETPVEAGQFEGNPIASVPELVETIGGALDLDQNSAALYLQLAALPAPKDKTIRAWNGWSPKVHKAAQQKLIDRELVIEAKRSRAGRSVFVHGGWEPLKSPLVPIETWKLPLFGVDRDDEGRLQVPFGEILPLAPIHEVFARAWERIESGDKPRYEEPGK